MDSHRSNSATLNSRSVLWDRTRPGYVTSFPSSRSRYGSSGTQPSGLEAPLSPSTPAVRATWVVEMESYLQASAEKCSQEFQETVATLSDMVKEHRDTNEAHCFSSPALSRRLNKIPTAPLNSTQDHTTLMSTIHFLLNELRGAQLQIETLQKVNQQLVHQRSNGWQEQEQEQQAGNFGDEREVISSSLLPRPEHSELRLRLARAEEVLDCSNSVIHTQTLHIHQGTMERNRLRWRVYAYRLLLYDTAASNSRPEHKINSYQFQVEPSASHTEAHQISSVPHTSCYSAISHPTPQSLTVCHLDEADVPKVFDLFEYALIGALPSGRQLFEILRALGLFASLPRAQSIQRQLTCLGIPLTECVDNVSCSRSVHSGYRHHFIDRICFESILRYALGTSKTIVPPDTRMETAFLAHPNQPLPGCPETRETTEMNTTRTLPQELGLRDSMYPLKRRFVLQEDEAHFAFRLLCPHNTCSPEPPAIRGEQIPVILRILGIGEPTLHHSAQSESANPDALPRRFHFPGKKLNLSEFCALIRIAQTNPVAV